MPSDLKTKLKKYRLERNLTQEEMADIIGIDRAYYSLIETGNKLAGIRVRKQIYEALKIKGI